MEASNESLSGEWISGLRVLKMLCKYDALSSRVFI